MLSSFDWLRRSDTGAELLATMQYLESNPLFFSEEKEIGPPLSGVNWPCQRCWIYSCLKSSKRHYCKTCQGIMSRARNLGAISRSSIVIWGFVNDIPKQLRTGDGFRDSRISGSYVHDHNHFLMMMHKKQLLPWLREIFIYHGSEMLGLVQIFSTVGAKPRGGMGDLLCRAIHHETRFPMDQFRIRFFADPYQLFFPHLPDNQGLLTFEASEFLRLLEMAGVFRSLFRPEEQKMLYKVVMLKKKQEKEFYWGRLMGYLNQEAKDMLNAWKVKQWPPHQVGLLFKLIDYVEFTP